MLGDATVLIVDDRPANVEVLEMLLQAAGVPHIHTLSDPHEAVQRCLDLRPDLVLLDLHMPGLDGYGVMEALGAALSDDEFLPVLVLTADDTSDAKQRALASGAKDFLTKPFDPVEVVLRVRNLLETRALYGRVRDHNARLKEELRQQREEAARLAAEHGARRQRIEQALASDALHMVFQPIVDLDTGELVGAEALSRFSSEPQRPPNHWFAEAARVGLGTDLELKALAAALSGLEGLPAGAYLSINVSAATAATPTLGRLLDRWPAQRVVLELTEHTEVEEYAPLIAALEELRRRGVRIAVDDAGSGYSGLRHILRLHPDIIKLDTDLTRGIDADPARRALASSLVVFATELQAVVVAEGIETPQEADALRALGVPFGQGYYLGRPGALPAQA